MEQYLSRALGRVNISVDAIMQRASNGGRAPVSVAAKWGLAVCAAMGIVIGLLLVLVIVSPRAKDVARDGDTGESLAAVDKAKKPKRDLVAVDPTATGAIAADENAAAAPAAEGQLAQAPAAAPVATTEPWELEGPAEASAQALFDAPTGGDAAQSPEDLQKWFAKVDGQRGDFGVRDVAGGRWTAVEGLVRLRAPLKPGTALRLSLFDYNQFRLHCWAGKLGVTLDYYDGGTKNWAAYFTQRKDSEPIRRLGARRHGLRSLLADRTQAAGRD